jgi:hypothetical protein
LRGMSPPSRILPGKGDNKRRMSHWKRGHSSMPRYVIWLIAGAALT